MAVSLVYVLAGVAAAPAAAQDQTAPMSPLDLPRPGYEPRPILIGRTAVRLEIEASALYDSNVYATSTKPRDDLIGIVRPRIEVDRNSADMRLHSEVYAEVREHGWVGRESAASFGAAASAELVPGPRQTLSFATRYDRAIESRADPETRRNLNQPPRRIDILGADLGYGIRGTQIGLALNGGYQQFFYRDARERDRNLRIYRGSASIAWRPSAPISIFIEGFATRRDFITSFDINGINRDATTLGLLAGVSRDVSSKLRGRFGVGAFRFDPDDRALSGFTGFAANGQLTWSPRPRTALTAQVSRGDVATVRSGATNRTDTQIALRVDQEARHNLLLTGEISWLDTQYRGIVSRSQQTFQLRGEARYLANRVLAPFVAIGFARRDADLVTDRFTRATVELGVRIRF
ncbi:MAG: outer membrane beta-barrel protein [Sphingomonas sp.]